MTNLRCTVKLLKRLGLSKVPDPPPGNNALGDWYADILYLRGAHLVLCVSEKGRLPLVDSARDLDQFPGRLPRLLREVLVALGVPAEAAEEEAVRTASLAFGPTRSRSVLGTINDFATTLRLRWDKSPALSIFDWSLQLAETPCGPLGMQRPRDAVLRLLDPASRLRAVPADAAPPERAEPRHSALTPFDRARIDRLFIAFRDNRIPPLHRGTVNLVWAYRGSTVTLMEQRPRLMEPDEWMESKVAQFRRDDRGLWSLYCRDRNGRWHRYRPVPPSRTLEALLNEVNRDPTGIFWG